MGYDISVRFKTTEERDQMFDFLQTKKDFLDSMAKTEPYGNPYPYVLDKGENLGAYAPKCRDKILGFHGTLIAYQIWSVCAWMSMQSNYRKETSPIIYYDDEVLKVSVNGNIEKAVDVDSNGVINKTNKSHKTTLQKLLNVGVDYDTQRILLNELHAQWTAHLEAKQSHKMKL